jgi:iron complex outermembrane recepter protein
MLRFNRLAPVVALLLSVPAIAADDTTTDLATELPPVTVTANPFNRAADDLVQPVDVLHGSELDRKRKATIGETLEGELGVSSADFGPGVGRPVIRGQGGARVLVLENGIASMDLSTVSGDHAVSIDPLGAEQVEIIKGPATLIYGSAASAGVVNVVNPRLREKLDPGLHGALDTSYGDNANERQGGFNLSYGFGSFVLGGDWSGRRSDDFEIPGLAARFPEEHEEGEEEAHEEPVPGLLQNSAVDTRSGALYGAWITDRAALSLAVSRYDSDYGVPGHAHEHEEEEPMPGEEEHAEGGVTIGIEQQRVDAQGLWFQPFAGFEKARLRIGVNRYEHTEFEAPGVPGTVFENNETEVRFELTHHHVGDLRGVFGVQYGDREFSAIGEEAFVPPVDSRSLGLFVVEELAFGEHRLEAGARLDRSEHAPAAGEAEKHTPLSLSLGAVFNLDPRHHLRIAAARSQRAPVAEELFAFGPHLATASFERGHAGLDVETATNLEIGLDRHNDRLTWSLALFYNRIADYIYQQEAADRLNADGSAADPVAVAEFEEGEPDRVNGEGELDAHGALLLVDYRQASANFLGAEAEIGYALLTGPVTLNARLFGDLVRGELRDGGNLPRVTPPRFGVGLDGRAAALSYALTLTQVREQDRVSTLETPTDGYDLLSADLGYTLNAGETAWTLYLRGRNLLDEDARRHTSFLKDLAPLPGRSLFVGLRAVF